MCRVCILAYDALDPYLVKRFRLRYIRQEFHGIVDVSMFPLVATPIIWASFITGRYPHEHGVVMSREWKIPLLPRLFRKIMLSRSGSKTVAAVVGRGPIYKLYVNIPRFIARPFEADYYRRRGVKTIFDYARRPAAVDVPAFNQSERALELKGGTLKVVERRMPYRAYASALWEYHRRKKRLLLKVLDGGGYDLVMFHFEIADLIGHLRRGNIIEMWKVYNDLNALARKVREKVGDESLVLIVSDHGMKPIRPGGLYGIHSPYGFWSSNLDIGLPGKTYITSFFEKIVGFLRLSLIHI